MKDKIRFQDPPVKAKQPDKRHPTIAAVRKKPDAWALAATVKHDEVPEWYGEAIHDPDMRVQIHPQDPADPESPRDVYIQYVTKPHQHYLEPATPAEVVTEVATHPHLDTTEEA